MRERMLCGTAQARPEDERRLWHVTRGIVAALFGVSMLAIVLLLLFAFPVVEFDRKRQEYGTLLPMAAFGVAAGLCLAILVSKWPRRHVCGAIQRAALPAACAALFFVQVFICYHGYFLMGWDSISTMKSAYAIAGGDELIDNYYLSLYPNNALLTLLFGGLMRLFRLAAHGARLDRCVFFLIVVQCALNSATAYLLTRIAQRWFCSARAAAGTFLVYAGFTGLSPWLMVPYSDSMGLIVPTLILYIYQRWREGENSRAFWPVLGVLTWIGYSIKPQCCIVSVAIVLYEGVRMIMTRRAAAWLCGALCVLLLTVVGAGPVTDAILDASPIEMREGRDIGGLLHYVMLGLNPESHGVYRDEDMYVSARAENPQARREAQLAVIRERISAMSAEDWVEHLTKKALSNFADSPVIWSFGGAICWQEIEDKDDFFSPLIKRLIAVGEVNVGFSGLFVYFECFWLAILVFSLLAPVLLWKLRRQGNQADLLSVMMLSVFGLLLFQMIFEAGNRYFMVYTPFMVLLAAAALRELTKRIGRRRERGNKECSIA